MLYFTDFQVRYICMLAVKVLPLVYICMLAVKVLPLVYICMLAVNALINLL